MSSFFVEMLRQPYIAEESSFLFSKANYLSFRFFFTQHFFCFFVQVNNTDLRVSVTFRRACKRSLTFTACWQLRQQLYTDGPNDADDDDFRPTPSQPRPTRPHQGETQVIKWQIQILSNDKYKSESTFTLHVVLCLKTIGGKLGGTN